MVNSKSTLFLNIAVFIVVAISTYIVLPFYIFLWDLHFLKADPSMMNKTQQFAESLKNPKEQSVEKTVLDLSKTANPALNGIISRSVEDTHRQSEFLPVFLLAFSLKSPWLEIGTDCLLVQTEYSKNQILGLVSEIYSICESTPYNENCLTKWDLLSKTYYLYESGKSICQKNPKAIPWRSLNEEF